MNQMKKKLSNLKLLQKKCDCIKSLIRNNYSLKGNLRSAFNAIKKKSDNIKRMKFLTKCIKKIDISKLKVLVRRFQLWKCITTNTSQKQVVLNRLLNVT